MCAVLNGMTDARAIRPTLRMNTARRTSTTVIPRGSETSGLRRTPGEATARGERVRMVRERAVLAIGETSSFSIGIPP